MEEDTFESSLPVENLSEEEFDEDIEEIKHERGWVVDFQSIIRILVPVVSMIGADFIIGVIQMLFVGHIGTTEMAAVALASSFCNVTGFSIAVGLLSAMDTLSSQAFGARNFKKIGVATNQSFFALGIVTLLLFPLWMFSGPLLILLGQEEKVVELASLAIRISWLALYPSSMYFTLRRYLQNQGITRPLLLSGFFSVLLNIVCLSILMFVFNLGFIAAPITILITKCSSLAFLAVYIYFLGIWKTTWVPFSKDVIVGLGPWLKLAIPGMVMVCAEWWGLEINIFLAGMMGVSSLAAFTLMYTILTLLYTFPLSVSITAGTRIGNAVGEQDIPQTKRLSVMILCLGISIQASLAVLLFVTRHWWPHFFTEDQEVLKIIQEVTPIICIYIIIDSLQTSIGGILRGAGKQALGAASYVFSYYIIGLSFGLFFAFYFGMDTKGLWLGTGCAAISCLIILGGYFSFGMKWDQVILESQKRLQAKLSDIVDHEEEMNEIAALDDSKSISDDHVVKPLSSEN